MKISTKGRYALRLMVDLAISDDGTYISLRDVSERQEVSMKYMEQIVGQLTKAELLHSVRGPQGGYKLARRPGEYLVGEILRVTEGSLAPVACLDVAAAPCARSDQCSTLAFWEQLNETISSFVDGVTLEDLVIQEQAKQKKTG